VVAIKQQQSALRGAGNDGAGGNRIATYADNVYAGIASEINAVRNGQGPINRISQNLSPVANESAVMNAQRGQAQQIVNGAEAAQVEQAQEAASTQRVDAAVGYADTAMQVAAFAPIAVGGAQMALGGVSWVGNKAGSLVGLKSASKVGEVAKEARSWNEITFNEVGHATGTKGVVGSITQTGANVIADPLHWVGEKTGLSQWRASANAGKAAGHLTAAKDLAKDLTTGDIMALGGLKGKVAGASHAGQLVASETHTMLDAARQAEGAGKLSAAGSKFLSSVEDSVAHHNGATMWGNVKGAVKKAPSELGKGSVTHTLMNGAFIGMSALSMFGDARGFSQNLASLRQMYADMTGEDVKNVSSMKVLTGSVPEPVAAARAHMIKTFGVKQMFDVGNIALNVAMLISPKWGSGWKGMAAMIGTQVASTAVDGYMGESILPIHKAFSDAYKSGKEVPPEFYAAYLYAASAELRNRGEKGQEFATAVAQQYAAEHVSPGQLLNEIQNGKLMERIKAISGKADQAQVAQPAQEEPAQASAVSRLNGERTERPVVGKFTNKLNQEAQMATVGQSVG